MTTTFPGTADPTTLEALAARLAKSHAHLRRAPLLTARLADESALARAIAHAAQAFRTYRADDIARQKASEWLLDNYYICERALRQVRSEIPLGFRRRLPHAGDDALPRVLQIARALVRATALDLDEQTLCAFVDAYQKHSPLTVAELWALPTMIRLAVVEELVQALEAVLPAREPPRANSELAIDPALGVERSIRALRLVAEIDWKAFFGKSSVVEAILTDDPAGIYSRTDFETCDACRRVVEELAWRTDRPEPDVARAAIALARQHEGDQRLGHVGNYLIGTGRLELEDRIGYRPHTLRTRVRRGFESHPTLAYLSLVVGLTIALAVPLAGLVAPIRPSHAVLLCALSVVPISSVAVAMANAFFTTFLTPRTLPKLDFSDGIPAQFRTAIVVPALLELPNDVDELLQKLEVHYLSHPDPALAFVLLVDHVDSVTEPDDAALVAYARARLDALNTKYTGKDARPFHLLYRQAQWNQAEERFMGWERKRGKLEEFNRLLRGDTSTSFRHRFGDAEGLVGIRFVLTLDADTRLPLGAAQRLVGLMAHPLNQSLFDAKSHRVLLGYTIVQPRIETSPLGGPSTWFARMHGGETAIDIYTRAVSDVYQDLFGAGIYVGKGIYDVDAFMKSLDGRVPENALASHDLFEGALGRAGLATDIVLFEEYPHHYLVFARRQHRWIRGDWQLLPWLFPRVPGREPHQRLPNVLSAIDRWKIFDNMRRSLLAPSVFALVGAGLCTLPERLGSLALLPLLLPLVVTLFASGSGGWQLRLGRWALGVLALPHQAWIASDAIVRVLGRLMSRKRLLEWVTAAHTARSLRSDSPTALFYREMSGSVALVLGLALRLCATRPAALAMASPVLALWLLAPVLLQHASRPRSARAELADADRRKLRRLARRTWLFFESFVGPGDQWLPPDNFQEEPSGGVAHRTSPTNIGLLLIAELSAHDFGYIGPTELCLLLGQSFDSLLRLERHNGHWLNWYSTKNLEPLLPRYVSTVDSGNLAGALITLAGGCKDALRAPILGARRWDALHDALGLLEEAASTLPRGASSLAPALASFARDIDAIEKEPSRMRRALAALAERRLPELETAVLAFLEEYTGEGHVSVLRELRTWLGRLRRQVQAMRRDFDTFLLWLDVLREARERGFAKDVPAFEPFTLSLEEIAGTCEALGESLSHDDESRSSEPGRVWSRQAVAILAAAAHAARSHRDELLGLASKALQETRAMDFKFLFDAERRLLHVGYNVTSARLDPSYYDLLASESRVASFVAIVLKQVPVSHWYALGRPVTLVRGAVALLSWGATMFEYLLPNVFMRSHENTLLAQSADLAVTAQIDYGRRCETPWGISESGFAKLDTDNIYQYRSFGVPGLGLKRGLEDDLVIAPYASVLAVALRPRAVMRNLAAFARMGAIGTWGLYEAIDYRSPGTDGSRGATGYAIVRSHMAHHQGMILASLNNALHGGVLVERFHADVLVHTGELLLNERLPSGGVAEKSAQLEQESSEPAEAVLPRFPTWSPDSIATVPEVALLTNGRLTTMVTDTGAGSTRWNSLGATPECQDGTRDLQGTWIYVRDKEGHAVWSATAAPTRPRDGSFHVTFATHKAEFHQRFDGVSMRTEIAIAHLQDVEIRHVTLHNESDRRRILALTSYLEPVLESPVSAARHPAFSRLFIECEPATEIHGVVCERRKKDPNERTASLVHRAVWDSDAVVWVGSSTDRAAFVGRLRDARAPQMGRSIGAAPTGKAPLDPAVSLELDVVLAPGMAVEVAFVTALGPDPAAALDAARQFGTMHSVGWAIRDAERECARRLHSAGVVPSLLSPMARLISRVLFPQPFFGASGETRRAYSPSQRQLWGQGISGDDPIIVVRVRDPEANVLVREVLSTYRYLRACGVSIEVVFLDKSASGYQTEQAGTVRDFLVREGAAGWLHQRGGLFVLSIDQLGPEESHRIEAAACVLLDAERGSLVDQWSRLPALPPPLPAFGATRPPEEAPRSPRPLPNLAFFNDLGGFTPDGREYVVLAGGRGTTPAPWCNVLANPDFGCLVSESALGVTWSVNSGENRLTPWRNDPVGDTPSEALFLRDEETAEVWSPTPLPAAMDADILVRHGAGYTVYEQNSHGLVQELTVLVPPDHPVKILRLRIENRLDRPRRLTATHYVEWLLGAAREDHRTQVLCDFDVEAQCLLARSTYNSDFAGRVAFVSSDRSVHGFTCDRTEFLGRSGGYARPAALTRWGLAGTTEPGVDPCAALQTHLELGPAETVTAHFVVGEGTDREHALALAKHYRGVGAVDDAWQRLIAYWDDLLGSVHVKTPEPAMDLMLNRWLLYQTISSRFFARAGFYQAAGAFGFRDQLQDVMALVHGAPALARAHILTCAAHQFEEGDVLHWWHPPCDAGVRTHCSDDLLWLPFVTAHYVEATGDNSILTVEVPFLQAAPLESDEEDRYARFPTGEVRASLFEHCRRALLRGHTRGPHGLPLIGRGDWNDGMNRVGAGGLGESVWLAWFLCATTRAFASLCDRAGRGDDAASWRDRAEALSEATEKSAWDGAWYVRAFYDDGAALGAAGARSCRIDSIAQSWSVLSGAADPERASRAVRSADELLVRERDRLVLLLDPPFEGAGHDPGYIRAYPPGVRENGGQYTHAAAWLGWAHVRLGDGALAESMFALLNPIHHAASARSAARYRVEPYVLAADVYSARGWVGRGGWTWYTGSAAWTWRLGMEGILGITRVAEGIRVQPCIPPQWPGFEAIVAVGKTRVHIVVDNSAGVGHHVISMTLDGAPLPSGLVKLAETTAAYHEVLVVLGAPRMGPAFGGSIAESWTKTG